MSTVKKVNQYMCDFCNTKKYSKHAINVHEKHCTKNPNRHCRMCDKLYGGQNSIEKLKSLIPEAKFETGHLFLDYLSNAEEINDAIKNAMEKEFACPMCIMAVLRQKGIPVPSTDFDYKKEREAAFSIINDSKNYPY